MKESSLDTEQRQITITYGDISLLQLPNGAIVNPSNTGLILNGGVSEQIARRAGPMFQQNLHILRSSMRNNTLELGRVIETEAGQIAARYLFHASVVGRKATSKSTLTQALLNIIDLSERLEVTSLGIPALGVGLGKFPFEPFIELFWTLVNEELPRSEHLRQVVLCLYDENEFNDACAYIEEHQEIVDEGVEVEIGRGSLWQGFSV